MENKSSALYALSRLLFPILLTLMFFSLSFTKLTEASSQNITVYYFITEECSHCIRVREFINSISENYYNVFFREFDLSGNDTAIELFISLADGFEVDEGSRTPPMVFIGDLYLTGRITSLRTLRGLYLNTVKALGIIAIRRVNSLRVSWRIRSVILLPLY